MIPGGKRDTQSFGDIKGSNRTHEVTKRPATGMYHNKYPLTMAQYANIEHGEEVAKVSHIHHSK